MAKLTRTLRGISMDMLLSRLQREIVNGSASATLEDSSDMKGEHARCCILVFERYSAMGSNRVSLSITLFQEEDGPIQLCAITSGGSQAMFFKLNTIGEETFLDSLRAVLDRTPGA